MSSSKIKVPSSKPFDRPGVADYERRRYRGLDQRLVDRREQRLLARAFARLRELDGDAWTGPSGPLVLDAPCGYGRFSGLVLEEGARLVSADLAGSMVARALERRRSGRHVGGIVSDLRGALAFKPGAFDYVLSMRLFHHLHAAEDREAVLREFARVASRGVVMSFYRFRGLHALQRRLRRLFKPSHRDIKMVAGETFEREASAAGLVVDRVYPLFRGIHAQHIVVLRRDVELKG
jgi:SAM-dependent methyltransferase